MVRPHPGWECGDLTHLSEMLFLPWPSGTILPLCGGVQPLGWGSGLGGPCCAGSAQLTQTPTGWVAALWQGLGESCSVMSSPQSQFICLLPAS